ncbi:MAG: 2-octaprenyl-6-methoxyphenyl hydroxylase [Nitrosomonadales bacterium]|nr:2-octaprenyl-6-methoxyphenyl hydroxylase [Nitrosomonadales bacterium]
MIDCAVIGGGPVGLVFAILNHSNQNKIQIFEAKKSNALYQDSRALALSNGSRLILEEIGVWERLKKNITNINRIHTSQVNSFGRTLLDAKEFNEKSLGFIVSYGDLMKTLIEKIEKLNNVEVIYETKVTKCFDDKSLIHLSLQNKNETKVFQSNLVILADGANDKIEGLELQKKIKPLNHSAIVTKVSTELPHQNTAYERFTDEGPIALLPNKNNKFSLVWTGPNEHIDKLANLNEKSFLIQLHKSFGDRVGNFKECEKRISFHLKHSSVSVLHPNIVALGNASQTMHPVAGQGLNTGFKDAYKLNKAIKKFNDDIDLQSILDGYKKSRSGEQRKILDFTEILVNGFSSDLVGLKKVRGFALSFLDITKPIKNSFVRKLSYGE